MAQFAILLLTGPQLLHNMYSSGIANDNSYQTTASDSNKVYMKDLMNNDTKITKTVQSTPKKLPFEQEPFQTIQVADDAYNYSLPPPQETNLKELLQNQKNREKEEYIAKTLLQLKQSKERIEKAKLDTVKELQTIGLESYQNILEESANQAEEILQKIHEHDKIDKSESILPDVFSKIYISNITIDQDKIDVIDSYNSEKLEMLAPNLSPLANELTQAQKLNTRINADQASSTGKFDARNLMNPQIYIDSYETKIKLIDDAIYDTCTYIEITKLAKLFYLTLTNIRFNETLNN